MSVQPLITAAKTPSPGNSALINKKEAEGIVKAANGQADVALIQAIQQTEMTPGALKVIQKFLATQGNGNTGGVTPTQDVKLQLRADHKVWTCTYWPTAGDLSNPNGNPEEHLWAKGGVLEKFDQVLAKLGKKTGALDFEKRPYFNYLVGSDQDAGYYIPSGTIEESDAERTTGVDLDGDGKVKANVKYDLLAGNEYLGEKDGKTNGSYDVSWFGNCDKVAAAGAMFKEPTKSVTFQGVTFTPNQIKGLLVLIVDSQMRGSDFAMARYNGSPDVVRTTDGKTLRGTIQGLDLKDFRSGNFQTSGNKITRQDYDKPVKITLLDGTVKTIPVEKQVSISRESEEDSAATFHETMKKWFQDKRPFCMDHDSGSHVWNDSYDGANIIESAKLPPGVNPNQLNGDKGNYSGGKLTFVTTEMLQDTSVAKRYKYWIEEKNGKVVNSGWLGGDMPDFMWRPATGTPSWTGKNERNPFVDPAIVKDIYLKSF